MLNNEDVSSAVTFIKSNQKCLLSAPTGSGKTTLIPFELAKKVHGRVAVGVPTVISTQSITRRVSSMNKNPDFKIDSRYRGKGYREDSKLVFMTFGILLVDYFRVFEKKVTSSTRFPWDYVIVDEAHTGSLEISIIISLHLHLIEVLGENAPSLVLMTATPISFKRLENIPHVKLEPKNVTKLNDSDIKPTVFLSEKVESNNFYQEMANIITKIHLNNNNKYHILAFVPGYGELNILYNLIERKNLKNLEVLRAHGGMTDEERLNIEKRVTNIRRLIIATNVAESSITIPHVAYVVDSGLEKRVSKGVMGSSAALVLSKISKNSSQQRMGRAGRTVKMKEYYIMMTEEEWKKNVKENPYPPLEITLISLHKTILTLLSYKLNPRAVLYEVNQEEISNTLSDLMKLEMISFVGYSSSFKSLPLGHRNRALYEDLINSTVQNKDAKLMVLTGHLIENYEITSKGKMTASLPLGVVACSFLWEWKKEEDNLFAGLLVACVMDTNFSRLFNYNALREDKYKRYEGEDNLTTMMKVLYDFILSNPEQVMNPNKKIVGKWVSTRQLRGNILLQILAVLKSVSFLLTEDFFVLPQLQDLLTRSKRTIEESQRFFGKKCSTIVDGKCILSSEGKVSKYDGFVVPDYFTIPFLGVRERTYDRLPIVKPEDVGLVSGGVFIPPQLMRGYTSFSKTKRAHSLDLVLEFLVDEEVQSQQEEYEYEDFDDLEIEDIDFTSYEVLGDIELNFADVTNMDNFREVDDTSDELSILFGTTRIIY